MLLKPENWSQAKEQVVVFEIPPHMLGEQLAAYLDQYVQIPSATPEDLNKGWSLEIMLDRKAFISIPNSLDAAGLNMSVIVTSQKLTC